jgi:hypothetical protein
MQKHHLIKQILRIILSKKTYSVELVFLIFCGLSALPQANAVFTHKEYLADNVVTTGYWVQPKVKIIFPTNNSDCTPNEDLKIEWNTTSSDNDSDIYTSLSYSTDLEKSYKEIKVDLKNTFAYTWKCPTFTTDEVILKIEVKDSHDLVSTEKVTLKIKNNDKQDDSTNKNKKEDSNKDDDKGDSNDKKDSSTATNVTQDIQTQQSSETPENTDVTINQNTVGDTVPVQQPDTSEQNLQDSTTQNTDSSQTSDTVPANEPSTPTKESSDTAE